MSKKRENPIQLMQIILALTLCCPLFALPPQSETWELQWSDEFDGTHLDNSKWETCPEWFRQGGSYWEADNHQLTGTGELRLSVTERNDSVFCGAVRTRNLYDQKYGYFEVRCKVPQMRGGWAAFWLMPYRNDVGNMGIDGTELDVFETINGWRGQVNHAIHWDGYGDEHQVDSEELHRPDLYDDEYHTFGMWWSPDEYIFYIDDQETWRTSAGGISKVEQYLKLTMEVSNQSWPGDWSDQVEKPIHWDIDYVRTYKISTETSLKEMSSKPLSTLEIHRNGEDITLTLPFHIKESTPLLITTLSGRVLVSRSIKQTLTLSTKNLSQGVYILSFPTLSSVKSRQIVIH